MNLNFSLFPKLSDAQKTNSRIAGEFRYFKSIKGKRHTNTIGFWLLGNFLTGGTTRYLTLPASGWDQRGRSGRGYAQGTFRGQSMVYGEFEYRFPITCNEFLGGVLFTNVNTTIDKDRDLKLFRFIQPAVGFGLRLNLDKASSTNLVLDYAGGRKSSEFYLNAGETF